MLYEIEQGKIQDKESLGKILPKRERDSHKGTYGKCAVVGGSFAYTGAPFLSASACLRSGVGYTALFVPKGILPYYLLKAPEILLRPLQGETELVFDRKDFSALLPYDAVAYGMGTCATEEVWKGVKYLLKHYEGKLLLDADALNVLATQENAELEKLFEEKKCEVVLTPHLKEFARLTKKGIPEIKKEGLPFLRAFAKNWGVTLLLKGATTVIVDKDGETFLNTTGCTALSKGGSGDVLSGLIAGLMASGASTTDGARIGAYLLGKSAEIASKEFGERSTTPSDVISCLGRAFLDLE